MEWRGGGGEGGVGGGGRSWWNRLVMSSLITWFICVSELLQEEADPDNQRMNQSSGPAGWMKRMEGADG